MLGPIGGNGGSVVGGDGGVVVTPDGSTVIGAADETTHITGSSTAAHTVLKNDDAAGDQSVRVTVRDYASTGFVTAMFAALTATDSTLYLGGGTAATGHNAINRGRLAAGSGISGGAGATKVYWHDNGVALGKSTGAPSNPCQIQTTGQAIATHWDDAKGSMFSKWDGSTANPNIGIGARTGGDLLFWHGSGDSNIENVTGSLLINQTSTNSLYLRCSNGSGGDVIVNTRGTSEKARFNGEKGINLKGAAVGSLTESGQLAGETATDNLVWVSLSGTKYRLDMTAV